jgi:hypothetical protein
MLSYTTRFGPPLTGAITRGEIIFLTIEKALFSSLFLLSVRHCTLWSRLNIAYFVDHQIAFSLLGDSGCISNTWLKSVSPVITGMKTSAVAVYRSIHTSQSDYSISSRKSRGWPEAIAQPTLLLGDDSSLKIALQLEVGWADGGRLKQPPIAWKNN